MQAVVSRLTDFLSMVYYRLFGYSNLDVLRKIRKLLQEEYDYQVEYFNNTHLFYLSGICCIATGAFGKAPWKYKWFTKMLWQRYRKEFSPGREEHARRTGMYWYFGEEEFTKKMLGKKIHDMSNTDSLEIEKWYRLRLDFMDRWINGIEKLKKGKG
jgi:hypothetical protein